MTAVENVEVPMMGYLPAGARRAQAKERLGLVEMDDRKDHLPNQLSGGQRQCVAVERALANNPSLVLADEPNPIPPPSIDRTRIIPQGKSYISLPVT